MLINKNNTNKLIDVKVFYKNIYHYNDNNKLNENYDNECYLKKKYYINAIIYLT